MSDPTANPAIVCGADEVFAMPLAATIASAIAGLGRGQQLSIFVLDGGLSPASAERLVSLSVPGSVAIEVLVVDPARLKSLPTSGHVNFCTYLRLLLPELLPASVERAIYLDADVLVLADLARLWQQPLDKRLCLAAQDAAAPVIDARLGLPNYRRCAPYLATIRPIPNYRELGLAPSQKYFNSGVMVVDLDGWRREDISDKLLRCLHDNRRHVRWWDQYALNVVLAERWGELDGRWNQTSHIYRYPSWDRSPLDEATFARLRTDPFIVHFNARRKPWQLGCTHPLRELFFRYVDMTPWAGFRPTRQPVNLRRWCRERVEDALVFAGRQFRQLTAWLS